MVFKKKNEKIGHQNHDVKQFSMLTYIVFIAGLVWFVLDEDIKRNTFARFHFKQSLILFTFHLFGFIIAISLVPLRKWLLLIVTIAFLLFAIQGMINAYTEQKKELPYIGHFRRTFDF